MTRLTAESLRIIPARAGFTRPPRPQPYAHADHPRSRGVYYDDRRSSGGDEGSSPLARGLQHRKRLAPNARRIIPARAGFTGSDSQGHYVHTDHPRSRGVYMPAPRPRSLDCGSSPLARGLPFGVQDPALPLRIIPARAGFTQHVGQVDVRLAGSSPLARGLREGRLPDDGSPGIIPARAGFTQMVSPLMRWRPDHPRSRGVYHSSGVGDGFVDGSSPLARGLPPRAR